MPQLPSLLGLVTFDVVARRLSFSAAGRALHVTQGAVSHRIRGLEEELGVALLRRTPRRVELTPQGEVLHRATTEAFERLRRGLVEMAAVGQSNRVTVSCSPSFAIRWLVPRIGSLRRSVPDIELYISAEDALVRPGAGSVDLCIRFGPGGYAGVAAELLRRDWAVPVCSPGYAAATQLRVPADLERCTLLHDDVLLDHADRVGWPEWFEAAGLAEVRCRDEQHLSHSHMAIDAAIAGQGVALARHTLVDAALASGQLVAPLRCEVASRLSYWLISPPAGPHGAAQQAFATWLAAEMGRDGSGAAASPTTTPTTD